MTDPTLPREVVVDGPVTFRSKAHLIDSVLGGLWDYPHKTEGVPVDHVRSWADAVFDDQAALAAVRVDPEPTEAMIKAGAEAAHRASVFSATWRGEALAVYRAMIAAAPTQEPGQGEVKG